MFFGSGISLELKAIGRKERVMVKEKIRNENQPCRKCGGQLVKKMRDLRGKIKDKKYYFKSYFDCVNCNSRYMNEADKVYSKEELYSSKNEKNEYRLLNDNCPGALSSMVDKHLNDGWVLYGNPFSSVASDQPWRHYQAVIKSSSKN